MSTLTRIHLNHIALIGHTYNEYKQMFGFSRSSLKEKKILDAAGGVSNFCAISNAFGLNVTALDTIYDLPTMELEQRCKHDLANVLNQLPRIKNLYNWDYFGDFTGLEVSRVKAFQLFLRDYQNNPKHYVTGSLTSLPFDSFSFDVTFVSHLLFLYDDLIDEDFHFETLKELIRVTKEEIIIYPLYNLSGELSPVVEKIQHKLKTLNIEYIIEESEYPVMKSKNQRMRIFVNQKAKNN